MKLTGKLKETVSKAETKEQAKELIAKAGMELTDEEMDKVVGGQSEIYSAALHYDVIYNATREKVSQEVELLPTSYHVFRD